MLLGAAAGAGGAWLLTRVLNADGPPWRRNFAGARQQRDALLEYGRRAFEEDFLDAVPLRCPEGDVEGVAFVLPYTYVFDADGDKVRTVQFHGAGVITPNSLFFGRNGRVLVTPGLSPTSGARLRGRNGIRLR